MLHSYSILETDLMFPEKLKSCYLPWGLKMPYIHFCVEWAPGNMAAGVRNAGFKLNDASWTKVCIWVQELAIFLCP